MSMKKTVAIVAAAGALAAVSVPAMAAENVFSGMYKFMGYQTNSYNSSTKAMLATKANANNNLYAEQRARIMYSAVANKDLKLVTHFELDSRFGGQTSAYKGTASGNDAGQLDADSLTLETKQIYLDFNDNAFTGANVKVGIQPLNDALQSVYLLADAAGVNVAKKFGNTSASFGLFRTSDTTAATVTPGETTTDHIIFGLSNAVSKDLKLGLNLYNVDVDTTGADIWTASINADATFGGFNVKPFLAFQFGDRSATVKQNGFAAGAVSKTKLGAGALNLSALYLSGDSTANLGKSFYVVGPNNNTSYFNAANMWLLVRNAQGINTSASVLTNDLTVGGRGLFGVFGGYEGTSGKVFYNANLGFAKTAETRTAESSALGVEANAQVGYKLMDNLSASTAFAYLFLGDGLKQAGKTITGFGVADAQNPYMLNAQLSYSF